MSAAATTSPRGGLSDFFYRNSGRIWILSGRIWNRCIILICILSGSYRKRASWVIWNTIAREIAQPIVHPSLEYRVPTHFPFDIWDLCGDHFLTINPRGVWF